MLFTKITTLQIPKNYPLNFKFSQINRKDPVMLFASYPVGFPMLKTLHQNFEKLTVVTHFTDTKNKLQNQVQKYSKANNIQFYCPVKKSQTKQQRQKQWSQFLKQIQSTKTKYKIAIACSFGYLIPPYIIQLFQKGCVLAHPSLIPKYRGGSPIFHAIANGQKQSGASYMQLASKFDHGNLLYQVRCNIGEKDSYEKVQKQLSQLMANNIMHVINNIDTLRPGQKQQDMDVSNIPPHQLQAKIFKQKRLNLNMNAQQLYNWSRAMINPRVKFNQNEIILFFDKVFLQDDKNQFKPGQVVLKGKKLYMKCKDKLIRISDWQQITKRPLPIYTFINRFIKKQTYKNQIIFQ